MIIIKAVYKVNPEGWPIIFLPELPAKQGTIQGYTNLFGLQSYNLCYARECKSVAPATIATDSVVLNCRRDLWRKYQGKPLQLQLLEKISIATLKKAWKRIDAL